MDIERALMGKMVQTGLYETVKSRGIETSHFVDADMRRVWEYMGTHLRKYNTVPSLAVLKRAFPKLMIEVPSDSIDYLCDEFVKEVERRRVQFHLEQIASMYDRGEATADAFMGAARDMMRLFPTSQVMRYRDMDTRIDHYRAQQALGTPYGITTGVPDIDKATFGIQPHEIVTVLGYSGMGKSTLGLYLLYNAYLQGKTALMLSLEMEARAIYRRLDTMTVNFNYAALKSLALHQHDLEKYEAAAARARSQTADIVVVDDLGQNVTVDTVAAELTRHKPDICCIDYITLMKAGGNQNRPRWESITAITQDLKALARSMKVPIIAVAQTGRDSAQGGARTDNVAYSHSIIQDSDIVLGLHADDEYRKNRRMQLRLLKNRDGPQLETDMLWDMDHMRFGPWSDAHHFTRGAITIGHNPGQVDAAAAAG